MTPASLPTLAEALRARFPEVVAIYVFGSLAKGGTHPESDVDLALFALSPFDALSLFEAAGDLAVLAGRDVDLVDLSRATTVMQSQVISGGRVLFCRDDAARACFEGRVYADYARLNEERRDVLERIGREGRIHG